VRGTSNVRSLQAARLFSATVRGNRVTLLHDGDACLPAMLTAIDAARREVLFEMYWFGSDRTGQQFAEALSDKARDGVRVCVVYDAVGSFDSDPRMFARMRDAGCEVHEYNPIAPWRRRFRLGLVNHRDHRKILVADQRTAFTGGVNACDHAAAVADGGRGWRDDMIRIEGAAALRFRDLFARTWRELGGRELPAVSDAGAPRSVSGSTVRVLDGDYRSARAAIRRSYLEAIGRARSHVYLSNGYFVPDRDVRRALAHASHAGVDVRVLLPSVSDVLAVKYAGRRLYAWLMRHGIRLYEWQGSVLHAKTAVIDDRWCTVGTYNMDHRSWRSNLEVNVMVEDHAVATAMARRFRDDLACSVPVDPHTWSFRPLSERVLERFFFQFRKLL
jgi:cardiolipin synthase